MSNWCYLLNRSVLQVRRYNIVSSIKSSVGKRDISYVANRCNNDRRRSAIISALWSTKVPSSSYATKNNLRLSQDNVVSSAFEDLNIPQELLHEYVWKNSERWPTKTAVVCSTTGKSYTYSQLRTLSGKFASSLKKCKLYTGSTIATILPNIPEYAIIIFGTSEAGMRVTTCNPISTANEINKQLQDSGACAVITTPEQYPVVKKSISENPNIKLPIIVIDDANNSLPSGSIRFSELISDSVEVFSESGTPDNNIEDTMFLLYSSGTTGMPKGVEISHRNIISDCTQFRTKGLYSGYETTETHQDVIPLILPVFHIYGLGVVLNGLAHGAKLIFLDKFNHKGAGVIKCLKEYKPNILYLAPPLVLFLGNSELISHRHLETVRNIISGAAPLGADSIHRLLTKTKPETAFAQGYGLTETSGAISLSSNGLDNLNAVGFLLPNTKLRVVGVDESNTGRNMGVNEIGELYVKGPQVMKGYYKNPDATKNAMGGEWYKTGDVGCYDETGHLLIIDRLKELIKVRGFQVAPAELEELLRSHDDVLDAAVTPEPHSRYGEIPKAFVVCKPGVKLNADIVKKFIAERVSSYKQLGSVKFIDQIPKSAAGKILRRLLKDL